MHASWRLVTHDADVGRSVEMNPEFDQLTQTETNIRPTDRHADRQTTTNTYMQTYANSYREADIFR